MSIDKVTNEYLKYDFALVRCAEFVDIGKTQKENAVALKVPVTSLSTWKSRGRVPADVLIAFCLDNEVSLDEFFSQRPKQSIGALDQSRLEEAIILINEVLDTKDEKLNSEDQADLIVYTYNKLAEEKSTPVSRFISVIMNEVRSKFT